MSSLADDNNLLDHNFLTNLQSEEADQDILDEFLDQRVYDSIGNNTPIPNSILKKEDSQDLFQNLYDDNHSNSSSRHNSTIDPSVKFNESASSATPLNNDYMYVEPHQYNSSNFSNSLYASPYNYQNKFHSASNSLHNTPQLNESPNNNNPSSSTNNSNNQLSDYEVVRDELSKLKFGNHNMISCPPSLDVPDASYLDFSANEMSKLPYKLQLSELPSYSRVETQIKLKFQISPPPPQILLHIPQDLISKNKFCLNESINGLSDKLKENLLYLDTYVLTSNYKKSCNICPRCIKREQKRASRRKSGNDSETNNSNNTALNTEYNTPNPNNVNSPNHNNGGVVKNNPNSWADESMMKKAIIFNCKEIVSFPPPNGLNNDLSKSLELSARIICYCRHHKESEGFKLLFVIKNSSNQVVAKQISSPIMIMDRKKNTSSTKDNEISFTNKSNNSNPNNNIQSDTNVNNIHPLSPNSIDESASEVLTNTDNDQRGLKRKKLSIDDSYNNSSNPMFNGSVNGFSPTSNSDTNTSTTNIMFKPNQLNQPQPSGIHAPPHPQFSLPLLNQPLANTNPTSNNGSTQNLPSIQRIIPAQGPIRGGIEVTLLGFNFRPGLAVKFGSNNALATHCWSETTIVTYLPPASQPGQVLVSFENHENMMLGGAQQQQVFTYTDDTDRQLIELALQIVGLKMNGKLEDAKNIAKRIVGSDNNNSNNNGNANSTTSPSSTNQVSMNKENMEWYDSAHKAVERLTKSNLSTEDVLINFLSLVDLPNCPIIIPNWQLCNNEGQSLLHLATLKNYNQLIRFLITHGCKIDLKDNQGLTPLFLASMCGHRDLINIFLDCKSNWNLKLSNDKFLKDYCDLNVLDIFNNLEECEIDSDDFTTNVLSHFKNSHNHENDGEKIEENDQLSKSISLDSLNSMFAMNYGRHISKMVIEDSVNESTGNKLESGDRHIVRKEFKPTSSGYTDENYSSDFADSEYDSNEDLEYSNDFANEDDYEDDYEDYEYSDYESSDVESSIEDLNPMRNSAIASADTTIEDAPLSSNSTIVPLNDNSMADEEDDHSVSSSNGLWQKVKNVFNNDQDNELPSYDDLFPFGPSSFHSSKPKTQAERNLNLSVEGSSEELRTSASQEEEVASDSSEDMVVSYINRPRKTVENDKMLLFFWFPILITILGLFLYVSIMGYRVESIENFKTFMRNCFGNLMIGNERLGRVFKNSNERVLHATRRILNEEVAN